MSAKSNILDLIKRGTSDLPPRLLFAGPEGIGKTTFAAGAPKPLFVCAEDGLTGFDHIERFNPSDTADLHAILDALIVDPAGYKFLTVDTTDWLERLIHTSLCKRDGKAGIEDYGYGKGYVAAEEELVSILSKLETLRAKHKIGIILLAHVEITQFNDPRGGSWSRYSLKGNKKFCGILREWPDACLFAVNEVFVTKANGEKKTVPGERVIHTEWSPAWDAKNRLGLPAQIPLPAVGGFKEFMEHVKANSAATLRERATTLFQSATKIAEADRPRWEKWIGALAAKSQADVAAGVKSLESLQ